MNNRRKSYYGGFPWVIRQHWTLTLLYMKKKIRVIALYLPQYHPTPDNDKWWGTGFTEWTNVGKAKPLFKGHYQPKVPADLGYYDLRLPEVREAQAELAREAGIEGFCYYHYWFGNGKQELELPFNEVLRLGKPDFPFCLCWANESWHSKFWNMDGTVRKKCLIEQVYDTEEGHIRHFNALLSAFKDKRYITVDDKPLFMIYKPFDFERVDEFIKLWNRLARENGLKGIHFVAHLSQPTAPTSETVDQLHAMGFDAVNTVGLQMGFNAKFSFLTRVWRRLKVALMGIPYAKEYADIFPFFISEIDRNEDVYPTLIPNWDHSPRSGVVATILLNSTPELFQKHIHQVLKIVAQKRDTHPLVFLKSWNEWGEGNYMEPDLKYGKDYIKTLRKAIDEYDN